MKFHNSYQNYIEIILGEKPFECTWECGRRFVSISARNEHERIVHAGVKRYRCLEGFTVHEV